MNDATQNKICEIKKVNCLKNTTLEEISENNNE